MNIIKLSVCMPTTGKILDANHIFLSMMHLNFVKNGNLEISLPAIKKVVHCKHFVGKAMAGRKKPIIQEITSNLLVKKVIANKTMSVLATTGMNK
jgi:hypothetical protein